MHRLKCIQRFELIFIPIGFILNRAVIIGIARKPPIPRATHFNVAILQATMLRRCGHVSHHAFICGHAHFLCDNLSRYFWNSPKSYFANAAYFVTPENLNSNIFPHSATMQLILSDFSFFKYNLSRLR